MSKGRIDIRYLKSEFGRVPPLAGRGRKVAVLVNEKKPAGNYVVSVDASALSSRLYFYGLTAGTFVETKRVALVR